MLRTANNNILKFIFMLLLAVLAACDGGGGSGSATTTILGTATATTNAVVAFSKTSLQFSESATVSAIFKKSDGTAAAGVIVTFSTTLGVITPTNGTATTDSNGVAIVTLTAGTTSGQGQVTASATVDNLNLTGTGLFNVNLPPLHLSSITINISTISNGGSTGASVTVLDASNAPYTAQPVDVVFTSTETTAGNATISSPVRTINGVATTTYKANTNSGIDTITATITGSSVNNTVTVNPITAGSIEFKSAIPTNIALKGMGGAGMPMLSVVTFVVKGTTGAPKANQSVGFELSTAIGGITLSQISGSTAADGTVSTTVLSGNVATPVRVKATIQDSLISTQSDQLVISTGIPSQDGMSVAFSTLNSESFNTDGVEVDVTAYLADHFGNPVPNDTTVSFSAQVGRIDPFCLTGSINSPPGSCTVKWRSSGTRIEDGKNAILAYAIGEESFTDLNGNGLADPGEFTDDLQAWRDDAHLDTGVYSALTDPFINYNGSGSVLPDGKFNGVLVSNPSATTLKHVFKNPIIVMSTSAAIITVTPASISENNATITFKVTDRNNRTMPAGTKVELSATTGTLSSAGYIVPNTTSDPLARDVIWFISPTPAAGTIVSGSMKIKVTSPAGLITERDISISKTF